MQESEVTTHNVEPTTDPESGGPARTRTCFHWAPGIEWITEGPRVVFFFLGGGGGLIGLGIVNCLVELFLHFSSSQVSQADFKKSVFLRTMRGTIIMLFSIQ